MKTTVRVHPPYDDDVSFLIGFLAAVTLASPFGAAEGSAIDDTDELTVEITVAYDTSAEAVIVRPFSDYEELPPTAMTPEGDGTWIAWVVFPTAQNWKVAFEGFPAGGGSEISETTDLLALGIDPVVIESDVTAPLPPKPLVPRGAWWLIVAVLLALSALGLLAYWAFASDSATVLPSDNPVPPSGCVD
ncbi:MAG: hypothetical protein DWP92_11475 [Armatimonadetes bacterium]|nr:MAG: hypothetical protein DWP92_11475 [Armatimonadota bacterium]